MSGGLGHLEHCDLVAAEIATFVAVARDADPATPVRTCGHWSMRDLIHHTGLIHRWAAGMVAEYAPERHNRTSADWPLPADPAGYPDWLGEAEEFLVPVLRAADPDVQMWAWGADQHARFWSRRMTHETTVHRSDAELALGRVPRIDPVVAADGVSEFLVNLPRAVRWAPDVGNLRGDGEQIQLAATDRPDSWTITLHPTGFTWSWDGAGKPAPGSDADAVTVAAPAADLYLLVWGRYPHTDARYRVAGSEPLIAHWQRNSAI